MKINIKATDKLAAAISAVEGKATARTITAKEVCEICEMATARLDIPKAAMIGIKITYTGAQHFAKSYQYRPISTHFTAEFFPSGWFVTDISRDTCPDRSHSVTVDLTDAAKEAILDRIANALL